MTCIFNVRGDGSPFGGLSQDAYQLGQGGNGAFVRFVEETQGRLALTDDMADLTEGSEVAVLAELLTNEACRRRWG